MNNENKNISKLVAFTSPGIDIDNGLDYLEQIEDPGHFDSVGTCIVKTSAMFVGELEFSDIPFTR